MPDNDWEQMADRHDGLPLSQEDIHLLFLHTHSLPTPKLNQQAQDPLFCSGEAQLALSDAANSVQRKFCIKALTNAQITGEMELDVSANELYSCTLDRYTKLSINRCNYFTSLIKRLQYSFKNYDLNITCNLGTLFFRVRNKISSRIFTEN